MAARLGIVTQKGLSENIRDRIKNPILKTIAVIIVIVAIFVGNCAYETGNLTGGILGIQAVVPSLKTEVIVIVLSLLAALLLPR